MRKQTSPAEVPVTDTALHVDPTVTHQKQPGRTPGEPKVLREEAGDEAGWLTKASAWRVREGRSTSPATGTQTHFATRRGRAARYANANGQSANGIVDEKSVEKLPATAGAVEGRNGAEPEWVR